MTRRTGNARRPGTSSQSAAADARADDDGMRLAEQPRQTQRGRSRPYESDVVRSIEPILASADPDDLVEIAARANAALPDTDPRKIRGDEVKMLKRLAGQARALNSTLIEHAEEHRAVGERSRQVSPEAATTAAWADRLLHALEAMVRRIR